MPASGPTADGRFKLVHPAGGGVNRSSAVCSTSANVLAAVFNLAPQVTNFLTEAVNPSA